MHVVIAEDSVLLRAGIQRLLADEDIDVVAAVEDGEGLLVAISEHRPDLAIVDVRMPPTFTDEGLRAALAAREQLPGLPVLVLSQYVEPLYAKELMRDRGGGVGYLLKDRVSNISQFIEGLRRVAGGGTVMDPDVVTQLMGRQSSQLDDLTPRESEVLGLMAEGLSNSAIAAALYVTDKAVDKHSNNVFRKLGLTQSSDNNRRVLAVLAYLSDTQ
ncbi:MAG: response regulator transcription factor [Stackebrandtia sp.]